MHRSLLVVSCLLLASCASLPPPREMSNLPVRSELPAISVAAQSAERSARQQTWRVQVLLCNGTGVGSAVALDTYTLITNAHVVSGYNSIVVSSWDGVAMSVVDVATDIGADLAVLRTADPLPYTARTGLLPASGETVTASGYPGGARLKLSSGLVVGLLPGGRLGIDDDVIRFEADIRQGNSGGPLYHQGALVGVVYAVETVSGDGLAIPVSRLEQAFNGGFNPLGPSTC